MSTEGAHRLPRTAVPEHYQLTFDVRLAEGTFAGEERVRLAIPEPVAEIVLNAVDLDIADAELIAADGTIVAATTELRPAEERLVVRLAEPAAAGAATLHLAFSGVLGDKLHGVYRSTFVDTEGATREIAATQFEPTDARRAFPCWDEPDRKATFTTSLVVDEGLTAVSNSEVVEVTDLGEGRVRYEFATTMRMSTYLVAFVVGPLEATDPVDVDGTALRTLCVPGKTHLAAFAQEIGAASLRFFSSYFGLPYPATKLDLIALPDFAMGAMENLGAVTFRETLLLIDPERATRAELERVADVVAHEIAHMWFGDLVTMRWWNGIWLNEAFATFMELLCVDAFRPEWQRWVSFGTSRDDAMVVDALATTRAVEFPVERPEEAEGMFDTLTYQKGAGVLRMLERYVGADEFRLAISRYVADHAYDNTETGDLWDAVEKATGEPARSIMDSWIYQGGFPLVNAALAADGAGLTLAQRRFRYLGDWCRTRLPSPDGDRAAEKPLVRPPSRPAAQAADPFDTSLVGADHGAGRGHGGPSWRIPVHVRASVGGEVVSRRLLLDADGATVDLGGAPDWVVVNERGWGFYRVRYDGGLRRRLEANLDRLDALERLCLASDTWASVLAAEAGVDEFLGLAGRLAGDDDPSVWEAIVDALVDLDRVSAAEDRPALRGFVRRLAGPAMGRLGWTPGEGEDERRSRLRATLVRALGVLGADPDVRERAAEVHAAAVADPASVDADVAGAVVAVVAAGGGPDEYEAFLARHRSPATPQEEVRYLYALAQFEDEALVARTLDMVFTDVRPQNVPFVLSILLANRAGGAPVWEVVKARWGELRRRLPENLHERALGGTLALSTPALAADVRSFLEANPLPGRERTVAQILEKLDVAVALRRRESPRLGATLRSFQP